MIIAKGKRGARVGGRGSIADNQSEDSFDMDDLTGLSTERPRNYASRVGTRCFSARSRHDYPQSGLYGSSKHVLSCNIRERLKRGITVGGKGESPARLSSTFFTVVAPRRRAEREIIFIIVKLKRHAVECSRYNVPLGETRHISNTRTRPLDFRPTNVGQIPPAGFTDARPCRRSSDGHQRVCRKCNPATYVSESGKGVD